MAGRSSGTCTLMCSSLDWKSTDWTCPPDVWLSHCSAADWACAVYRESKKLPTVLATSGMPTTTRRIVMVR